MTFREYAALVRLYEGCTDPQLKRWASQQLPELDDVAKPVARRWLLTAYRNAEIFSDGSYFLPPEAEVLDQETVVCREADLQAYKTDFAEQFDLAVGVVVEHEAL